MKDGRIKLGEELPSSTLWFGVKVLVLVVKILHPE